MAQTDENRRLLSLPVQTAILAGLWAGWAALVYWVVRRQADLSRDGFCFANDFLVYAPLFSGIPAVLGILGSFIIAREYPGKGSPLSRRVCYRLAGVLTVCGALV